MMMMMMCKEIEKFYFFSSFYILFAKKCLVAVGGQTPKEPEFIRARRT